VRARRLLFFETDLDAPAPALDAATIPLDLHVGTLDDLLTLGPALADAGVSAEEAGCRLAAGDVAIVGMVRSQLAHLQWISFRSPWVNEIGVTLRLGPGEAAGYGAFTAPAWRGHGIHTLASRFLNEEERRRGATRHVSWVWASNAPSLRAFAKLGRRRTKTVWSIRLAGMRRPLILGATSAGSPSLVRSGPEAAPRP
jgi:GNAT superfamily N-acetyltransferase